MASTQSLMTKYAPRSLKDYVTGNMKAIMVIYGYPAGTLTQPLLMIGPPGSGKTQLAYLLAREIRPGITQHDIHFVDCSQDTSINTIRDIESKVVLWPVGPLHIIILDEVDSLSPQAMNALKGLITKWPTLDSGVFFILTTNHRGALVGPVIDRCQELIMPATTVDDVLPMAKRVLDGEGIAYSEADLRIALTKDSSGLASFRDMWRVIEDIFTRRAFEASQA